MSEDGRSSGVRVLGHFEAEDQSDAPLDAATNSLWPVRGPFQNQSLLSPVATAKPGAPRSCGGITAFFIPFAPLKEKPHENLPWK